MRLILFSSSDDQVKPTKTNDGVAGAQIESWDHTDLGNEIVQIVNEIDHKKVSFWHMHGSKRGENLVMHSLTNFVCEHVNCWDTAFALPPCFISCLLHFSLVASHLKGCAWTFSANAWVFGVSVPSFCRH